MIACSCDDFAGMVLMFHSPVEGAQRMQTLRDRLPLLLVLLLTVVVLTGSAARAANAGAFLHSSVAMQNAPRPGVGPASGEPDAGTGASPPILVMSRRLTGPGAPPIPIVGAPTVDRWFRWAGWFWMVRYLGAR